MHILRHNNSHEIIMFSQDYCSFRVIIFSLAVDGGYSNWEPWSGCEGACGIGIKRRERTCTKPEPKGNGKDCSYFGNSTEQVPCETGKKCPGRYVVYISLIIFYYPNYSY